MLEQPVAVPAAVAHRESFDVIVVGAGQAGLATGYHLARAGLRFVLLDAGDRVGDAWRNRWDSLRLFTPARYDALDGMPFPGSGDAFPTKDEMADYLDAYARRFDLPVRCGVRVERMWRRDGRLVVEAGGEELVADHVIVATASYQRPRLPAFSADLDADIVQLHSSEYRRAGQLPDGGVLVVGAGNSGAELAMEISKTHSTWLSGRHVGHLPFRLGTFLGRLMAPLVLRVLFHRLLTIRTPLGRKARPTVVSRGGPLIRVRPWDMDRAGVRRVGRTAGARNGRPVLDDGTAPDVRSVVWCTGFHPGFEWIDLPNLYDDDGHARQEAGIATDEPGLYFVGMHFQFALSSTMVHGVSRDAARVVSSIVGAPVR